MAEQPLKGIRIADFTWYGAGPIATRFFSHHGAQVIKVESTARIDGLRFETPFAGGSPGLDLPVTTVITNPNLSGWFNNYSGNKLSFQLNVNTPEGQEVAKRLVAVSDIVIDNFTPKGMKKWGLTYEELVKIKPDIIVASMPLLGNWGPHKDHLGFGFTLSALGGLNYLTGMPDDVPSGTGTHHPDYNCNPCHTVIALLTALRYKRKTGKGQYIEVSQFESTVNVLETAILDYTVNGRIQSRKGNRNPRACPHGAYPCKGEDRWCVIAVFTDSEWAALCQRMGREDLTNDPQFGTMQGRLARADDVDRLVSEWTMAHAAEEVMELLQAVGVAAGVVQTSQDVLDKDPQLATRKHWVYLDHPEAGRYAYCGDAFKLSRTPGDIHSPAPCLGQHTDYVCREVLGMTEAEISSLRERKVFE